MKREPDFYSWYCQCRKKNGDPIALYTVKTSKLTWHSALPKRITSKPLKISMAFNNAIPIAKKSGATTTLAIWLMKRKVVKKKKRVVHE
jgi:hypothetical protein